MTETLIDFSEKIVLGTVQFGMDYGIANVSGKPTKSEVFKILEIAWQHGIRSYDTAPSYDSEDLLGEFIKVHGLKKEANLLTKISGYLVRKPWSHPTYPFSVCLSSPGPWFEYWLRKTHPKLQLMYQRVSHPKLKKSFVTEKT